jgi:hypothetical protein
MPDMSRSDAEIVMEIATALYGGRWQASLARDAGVSQSLIS